MLFEVPEGIHPLGAYRPFDTSVRQSPLYLLQGIVAFLIDDYTLALLGVGNDYINGIGDPGRHLVLILSALANHPVITAVGTWAHRCISCFFESILLHLLR